jgi:hypothetical protein
MFFECKVFMYGWDVFYKPVKQKVKPVGLGRLLKNGLTFITGEVIFMEPFYFT